jgi:hypothetical protein
VVNGSEDPSIVARTWEPSSETLPLARVRLETIAEQARIRNLPIVGGYARIQLLWLELYEMGPRADPDPAAGVLELARDHNDVVLECEALLLQESFARLRDSHDIGTYASCASQIAEQASLPDILMRSLLQIGNSHIATRHYPNASSVFKRGYTIASDVNAMRRVADFREGIARNQILSAGATREVIADLLETVTMYDAQHERLGIAETMETIVLAATQLFDFRLALEYGERAAQLYLELGMTRQLANIHNQLGMLSNMSGNLQSAYQHVRTANSMYTDLGDDEGMAESASTLALLDALVGGDLTSSVLQTVLEGAGLADDDLAKSIMSVLDNISDDDTPSTVELDFSAAQAAAADHRLGRPGALSDLLSLAIAIHELDADISAGPPLDLASRLSEIKHRDRTFGSLFAGTPELMGLRGTLYSTDNLNDWQGSAEQILASSPRGGLAYIEPELHAFLSSVEEMMGHDAEAAKSGLEAVRRMESLRRQLWSDRTRLQYYRQFRGICSSALDLAVRVRDEVAILEILESARADVIASVVRQGGLQAPSTVRDLTSEIARLESSLEKIGDDNSDGSDLEVRLGQLYLKLETQTSAAFARMFRADSSELTTLMGGLDRETSFLMFHLSEGRSYLRERIGWDVFAVWVKGGAVREVHRTNLIEDDPAFRLLTRFASREGGLPWTDELQSVAAELSKTLLPPGLSKVLENASSPERLIIIPDGILWSFPFAALRVAGTLLPRVASLSIVPSLELYASLRSEDGGVGAVGYIRMDLPGADLEQEALEAAFPPFQPVDIDRVVAALQNAGSYAIAVVSGHGNIDVGLMQGVDLGYKTVLRAGHLVGAQLPALVSFGACWVARMDMERGIEPLALPTVCLTHGARMVIGGIFEIASVATATILAATYQKLGRGDEPAEALRSAQVEFLDAHGEAGPISEWAGLVAIGR